MLLQFILNESSVGEEKMKTKEDNRMVKLEFQSCLFGRILNPKKSAHSLFGAEPFLLVHIRFTPSEGAQKLYKLIF